MSKVIKPSKERPYPFNWVVWQWFILRQRLGWNFLLPAKAMYKGRFWLVSKTMKFPPPGQRIFFSNDPEPFNFDPSAQGRNVRDE